MTEDLRCPECGALVSADAAWCGQCLSPLASAAEERVRPEPEPIAASGGEREIASNVVSLERAGKVPSWPCPSCGNQNPIQLNDCAVCGTSFAKLFHEEEEGPREVKPATALLWSALLPGLGHWMLGRRLDGIARIVLFVWTAGTTLVLFLSRSGKGGLGSVASLVFLFLGSAVILYLVSALDAYRIASGQTAVVSARLLLWGSAALVVLSAIVATVVALPAMRGR
jgi:hypothetical protein